MGRALIIAVIAVALGAFFWLNSDGDHEIVVSDATISQMMDGSIMMAATVANNGAPDVLIGASAQGFHHAHVMGATGPVVIPGEAAPLLAADGAHVMMTVAEELSMGDIVPVVLQFQDAGEVAARAKVAPMAMDHSNMSGVEAGGASVSLSLNGDATRDGVEAQVQIEGLSIVSRADDAPHKAGEGHAHVYLNGLKLQRLYDQSFTVGALKPGQYSLRVTINTNDHRPYVQGGTPLMSEVSFTVN